MIAEVLLVGAAPEPGIAALVAALAPEHRHVIAIDGGVQACVAASVVPDSAIGDFDSATEADLAAVRVAGTRIIGFPADKDVTDLDLALDEVLRTGALAVTVTGVVGLRVDHTLAALGSLTRAAGLTIAIVEPGLAGWVVRAGEALVLEGRGSTVSVCAMPETATMSVSGVKWPLERHKLEPASSLGTSNVIMAPEAYFRVHTGTALVLSPAVGEYEPAGYVRRIAEKDRSQ